MPYSWTCDEPLDGKGRKPINYSTTLGPVAVARATARCPRCHQGVPYLDEYLEITPQGMPPALASAVALMGTCEADEQAAALLQKNLHQEIDDNGVQRTVAYVAKLASRWVILDGDALDSVLAELPETEPLTLYVGLDGGRIRFRDEGWKEPCEGVIWSRDPRSGHRKRVVVGDVRNKANVQDALDRFIRGAQARCPQLTLVLIADGAEWIWTWAKQYEDAIKILDYYHLKEHLYEAGEALYPDDPAQVRTWVKTIRQPLWEGEVEAALARLARMQPRGSDAEKRQKQEALDALTRYLRNHQGLIAYAQHRERDRDLGSGTVESTCKQLFNMRMKGPGMFWSVPGAQAIIILRSVLLSDRWEQIWQPAFQEEQSLAVAA